LARKKQRKNKLWTWLTNRYELIIRNEADFAERRSVTFTYAQMFLSLFLLSAILMGGSLYLSKTLLAQWFNPENELNEIRYSTVILAREVDSLEYAIASKDKYIQSFRKYLDPEYAVVKELAGKETSPIESNQNGLHEENTEPPIKSVSVNYSTPMSNRLLVLPVDAYFKAKKDSLSSTDFTISFIMKEDASVQSIDEGTVELCTWDKDQGYMMVIHHANNLTSVYKGLGVLLKKVGSYVNIGEVIALSGKKMTGESYAEVEFELWHQGVQLDPEEYFTFTKE